MKRLLLLTLAAGVAAIAWYQAGASTRPLAQLFPSSALLFLEANDFSQLLSDWDLSAVKRDWLVSENYSVFERSNLYLKLNGFYDAYGAAAGFAVDMASLRSLAGDQSALALYDLQNLQFAYITRLSDFKATQSRLWLGRGSFQTRQMAGITFYTKTAKNVQLAFAVTHGYLLISSGEERMAGMLGLLAGKDTPAVASESWYKNSTDAAGASGELRLTMNLETLVANTYFRSYWVQRNAADVRPFLSGVADIRRTSGQIAERRLFLKRPGLQEDLPPDQAIAALSVLFQIAPADAGLYRVWAKPRASDATALIESRILNPRPGHETMPLNAPMEDQGGGAGSEGDLETRIDEPPLPKTGEIGFGPLLKMIADNNVLAMLQVQSSKTSTTNPFISLPCAVGLSGSLPWNADRVKDAIGGKWTSQTHGTHTIYRTAGLGQVAFATEGPLLLVASDSDLLQNILGRRAGAPSFVNATYAAYFRHPLERNNFGRIMTALDFAQPRTDQRPTFFSGNILSLSSALRRVSTVEVVERATADRVEQQVTYRLVP